MSAEWLRLVYVANSLGLGGSERMAVALARALRARGAAVEVVAETGPLRDQLGDVPFVRAPIDIEYPWRRGFLAALRRGAAIVAERASATGATIILGDGMFMALIARMAANRLGEPAPRVVAYTHGFYHRPYYWIAPRVLARIADRIVTVCHFERRKLMLHGCPGAKVDVVHNFVDVERIAAASRRRVRDELGLGPEVPLAGYLGRLAEEKRPDHFVAMAKDVLCRVPEARFAVVGKGPFEPEVRELADRYALGERLRFLGFRTDVPELLAALDLLVLPSQRELLPVAVLEAMAAGVPTVAYAVGGVPEAVFEGETGYLVPGDDLDGLADRAARILGDPALRAAMGEAARRRCAERFAVGPALDALLEIFAALGPARAGAVA